MNIRTILAFVLAFALGRMNVAIRIPAQWLCLCLMLLGTPAYAFDYLQTLPQQALVPADNPMTPAKIVLGKRLFFDVSLSQSRTYNCNRCHNLYNGGDDDRAYAIGPNDKLNRRSAPSLWNIGLQTVLYWDGRASSLEDQAKDHLVDPAIMAITAAELLQRLQASGYQPAFEAAFGNGAGLNLKHIAMALASFERALLSPNSPFDRYLQGNKDALTDTAIKGIDTFNNAGCLACHFGVNFAGPAPGPALGMGDGFYELFPNYRGSRYEDSHHLLEDRGRFEFSQQAAEKYLWRVPPLRNIALTAPYFHNGSAKTLREAVTIMGKTQFDKELTETQIDEITAFLSSLSGELPVILR